VDTLLDRFLRYVKVETTAVEDTDKYPSSPGQLELGKLLATELRDLKVADVEHDANGLVWGTIPGNVPGAPTIAFLAHQDTSPEASGKDVKPQIHRNYNGQDIVLPGDPTKVIKVSESKALVGLQGKTIVTTDGTTLLGADDKAGVAVIMTMAAELLRNPNLKHGPVRIIFTCDEEVGRGVDKVDIGKVGAVCAYTLDGEGAGELENETFSADLATVTITGVNIHPGLAYQRMVNAIRLTGQFLERLPWHRLAPETTHGREPFLHPYILEGGVPETKIKILLRSFETADLAMEAEVLRQIARTLEAEHPRAKITVETKKQYRNMKEHLEKEPRAVNLAEHAFRKAGLEPKYASIRGGTDGSRLSEMGLPTPNLSTGMHNFHSPLEFACVEEMEAAVQVALQLVQLWGKEK
jgi:tripeptide aminopeptidase